MNIMDFWVNNMCMKQKISEVNVMENASKITFGAVVLLLLIAVVLSAISVSVGLSLKNSGQVGKNENTDDIAANATVGTSSVTEEKKAIYKVCSENGVVTVKNAAGNTVKTLDVRTSFLPEADRAALEKGIDIFTEGELSALIADYSR